jgi:preprotein translocase subunit SecG
MIEFLIVVHTLVSLLLIGVILMQSGQGGLNSMMGGVANSMLGSTGANDFITKLTTGLGITFIGLALVIGFLSGESSSSTESIIQKDAASREVEMAVPNEYILPSDDLLPEEATN